MIFGSFKDLKDVPEIYTKKQVDSLVVNVDGGSGMVQSLELQGEKLSISGGNSISFAGWDTNALDDFSGSFKDLKDVPEIYTKKQVDSLVVNVDGGSGMVQSLELQGEKLSISGGNSISFEGWDTDSSDDFSGNYNDLKNLPSLFSGNFSDLSGVPDLYTKNEVDSLIVNLGNSGNNLGSGAVQSLNLEGNQLSISGGNSISFEGWDTDSSDDFSGNYNDLKNLPSIYTKNEVDSLMVNNNNNGSGGTTQNLTLEGNQLTIAGANTISFDGWDTDSSDDFSGNYNDLKNLPSIYTKNEVDSLMVNNNNNNNGSGGTTQNLTLEGNQLTIAGANTISFDGWDTDSSDDFDGKYSSLINAPKVYTQAEVDSIKDEIYKTIDNNYVKKAEVISLTTSRSVTSGDVGNTIACKSSATLTINSGFTAMNIGDVINLEIHGTTLTIAGSGVIINGVNSGQAIIGNNKAYTGGILRKTGTNTYIVL